MKIILSASKIHTITTP